MVSSTTVAHRYEPGFLSTDGDYWHWYLIRKASAQRQHIWPYVDPEQDPDQLPSLQHPVEPFPGNFNYHAWDDLETQATTTIKDLFVDELPEFVFAYECWVRDRDSVKRIEQAILDFNYEILMSIHPRYFDLIEEEHTPHLKMIALRKHLVNKPRHFRP